MELEVKVAELELRLGHAVAQSGGEGTAAVALFQLECRSQSSLRNASGGVLRSGLSAAREVAGIRQIGAQALRNQEQDFTHILHGGETHYVKSLVGGEFNRQPGGFERKNLYSEKKGLF
ncbi:hypothetical protein PC122_g13903 [Phytophthora cactorum]|nr:hypothetical protein PC122_g13903 [Phytophthora cactorum]